MPKAKTEEVEAAEAVDASALAMALATAGVRQPSHFQRVGLAEQIARMGADVGEAVQDGDVLRIVPSQRLVTLLAEFGINL